MRGKIKFFRSFTIWAIILVLIIFTIDAQHAVGGFEMLIHPLGMSIFLHLIPIALFIDTLVYKLPKPLLLLSALPYLIYYSFFLVDLIKFNFIEASLREENKRNAVSVSYDENAHSLITKDFDVTRYKAPIIYRTLRGGEFVSHRLTSKEICEEAETLKNFEKRNVGFYWNSNNSTEFKKFSNLCVLILKEEPQKEFLEIKKWDDSWKKKRLQKAVYTFTLNEKNIGSFVIAVYKALPAFPNFYIKLPFLNSPSSPQPVIITGLRLPKLLNTFYSNNQNNSVLGETIGINLYSEKELRELGKDFEK